MADKLFLNSVSGFDEGIILFSIQLFFHYIFYHVSIIKSELSLAYDCLDDVIFSMSASRTAKTREV